jgi:two-component system chemotaxis sensor kinase CheA
MIDRSLLGEYLSESEQLLEFLLADLDLVYDHVSSSSQKERPGAGDDSVEYIPALINRIFRTVHSLKGLSGMMGLPRVQALAHAFENILDDVRLDKLALDRQVARALQGVGAGLEAIITAAARGSVEDEEYQSVREILTAIDDRPRTKMKAVSGARLLRLSDQDRRLLSQYEEHRINENIRIGRTFYEVCVEFELSSLDTRFRAMRSKLKESGEIVATLPLQTAGQVTVGFRLVVATNIKESDIQAVV